MIHLNIMAWQIQNLCFCIYFTAMINKGKKYEKYSNKADSNPVHRLTRGSQHPLFAFG